MLEARRPVGAELLAEHLDESLRELVLEGRVDVLKRVERRRKLDVRRIDDAHVLDAVFGNEVQDVVHELAVRVDDAHAVPIGHVLADHELLKLRLSDAGLSDDVQMAAAVDALDAEDEFLLLERGDVVGAADEGHVRGIERAEYRQVRRGRGVFDYLDLVAGHRNIRNKYSFYLAYMVLDILL